MDDRVLRKASVGYQQSPWTKNEILTGLQYFFELNKRYPTAVEIDGFEFLPSSRSIQRQFGGLVSLRKELIPTSHSDYTQGEYRSKIARQTSERAVEYEEKFYNFLLMHSQALAVHEHKVMRPGNVSSDYFVYFTKNSGVIIDLFYAKDLRSLSGIVNIKLRRYTALPFRTYLVLVGNNSVSFRNISDAMARRKVTLPKNVLIDTEAHFKESTVFELKQQSEFAI